MGNILKFGRILSIYIIITENMVGSIDLFRV